MNLLVCEMAHVALTDDEDAYKAGLLRKLPGVELALKYLWTLPFGFR